MLKLEHDHFTKLNKAKYLKYQNPLLNTEFQTGSDVINEQMHL